MWNRDADWANDIAVVKMNEALVNGAAQTALTNIVVLDNRRLLDGHRLCESGVGLLEEVGIATWRAAGAADRTEWVSQIRTVTTILGPYQLQEGIHPSYWGELALRNCLRQAYDNGAIRGGTCIGAGRWPQRLRRAQRRPPTVTGRPARAVSPVGHTATGAGSGAPSREEAA